MKTKLLTLLIFILAIPMVVSEVECSKVFVVNFNYDNGFIIPKDKITKCGFSPDRQIQPADGYKAELISMDNEPLYSFRFNIPLTTYFDISDPLVKSLSGGMVILNETDFALIFPYDDKAKSIKIYNPRGYEVATFPLIGEQFIPKESLLKLAISLVLLLAASIMVYIHYRKKH